MVVVAGLVVVERGTDVVEAPLFAVVGVPPAPDVAELMSVSGWVPPEPDPATDVVDWAVRAMEEKRDTASRHCPWTPFSASTRRTEASTWS